MRDGTMLTVRAGSCSLWCSLRILVAATVAPLGRWNTAVKIVFVGIDGADREDCVGSGSFVADCQGEGSVEDGRTKCWWGRSDELCFIVVGMGASFLFLVVGAVSVEVVNGESKSHTFVGWLSGQKDCFDAVELCAMVGERANSCAGQWLKVT